tara:strand:- start:7167 stop:7385 length:219 start_codon:yes stop_codon:yes gene_type:complete
MTSARYSVHKNVCVVINFDGCGVGLCGYDLAVAMFAFEYSAEAETKINYESLKEALFSGYSEHLPFSNVLLM